MTEPQFEITKSATFDAAHYIEQGPADHRYRRLHGHSFRVEASVRGAADPVTGWVADLAALDEALRAVAAELDHGLLNEKPGLETPTLERLCLYFVAQLKPAFPGLSKVVVSRPTIGESCSLAVG
jgi:6-pyruvoyltetrahydropterin/6-carboxytetrahydropterin synthase